MAEKISCFKMTNFRALITLKIYSNIFKIRLFIRVTHCRNTRIQMNLSKNKQFSAKKARKKVPVCEMFEFSGSLSFPMLLMLSWKLKIIAYGRSSTVPPSFKLKLFYQYQMTCIVTKSSIIDDLGSETCLWSVRFVRKTLPTRFKHNKVDIYMFKIKM